MAWSLRQALFGPVVDAENNSYATATTPDQLIAASFIRSMTEDFEAWEVTHWERIFQDTSRRAEGYQAGFIWNNKTRIGFVFHNEVKSRDKDGIAPWVLGSWTCYVVKGEKPREWGFETETNKEVQLNTASSNFLMKNRAELSLAHKIAKEKAAQALAAMKANEAKWNIAEQLLGMKRNEFGALVPINPVTQ